MKLSKPKSFTFNKSINNRGFIFTFPEYMGLPSSIVSAVSRIGCSNFNNDFIWDDIVVDCTYYPNIVNIIRNSFNRLQHHFLYQLIDTLGFVTSEFRIVGNIVSSNVTLNDLGDDLICQIIIKPSRCLLMF